MSENGMNDIEALKAENHRLRQHVTELQRRGTELLTRARPAEVRFRRVRPETPVPARGSAGASGFDLHVMAWSFQDGSREWTQPTTLEPGDRIVCFAGIALELPAGYEAQVRPRSGFGRDHGIHVALGTIDADYRGEIGVLLWNLGRGPFTVAPRMRVAQLVIVPVALPTMLEAHDELSPTERGASGWGSTGTGATR